MSWSDGAAWLLEGCFDRRFEVAEVLDDSCVGFLFRLDFRLDDAEVGADGFCIAGGGAGSVGLDIAAGALPFLLRVEGAGV